MLKLKLSSCRVLCKNDNDNWRELRGHGARRELVRHGRVTRAATKIDPSVYRFIQTRYGHVMLLFRRGTYFARTATFVNETHRQMVSKSRGTLKHAPLGISVHSNQIWTRDVALSARYVLCQNSDFCKRNTQTNGIKKSRYP
jgi:hypothetical protein